MFEPKHTTLLEAFAERFGLPNNGDENARAWTNNLAEQFAFTFPDEGWGTKKAGPGNPRSTDVIARHLGGNMVGYDTVGNAGIAAARLVSRPEEMILGAPQVFLAVTPKDHLGGGTGTGTGTTTHQTENGISCFPLLRVFKDDRPRLTKNLKFVSDRGVRVLRAFAHLRPNERAAGDPWEFAGMDYKDPTFRTTLVEASKWVHGEFGFRIAWCLCGSPHVDTERGEERRIVDAVVDPLLPLLATVKYFEQWNEYLVNSPASGDLRAHLRGMARQMRSKLPAGFPIALSSPNSLMGGHAPASEVLAEITAMYGGDSGANLITMHNTRPEPIWNPETIKQLLKGTPFESFMLSSGEPRGPGASAGGDITDPRILGDDYKASIRGGAILDVAHWVPGIWLGLCGPRWPGENEWPNYWDVPNAEAILDVRAKLAGGTTSTGGGGTIVTKPMKYKAALKTDHGRFVCAESDGRAIADRSEIGGWEMWEFNHVDKDHVTLKSDHDKYLCAEGGGGGVVVANRNEPGPWETWTIVEHADGRISLRAHDGMHYLCAEGERSNPPFALVADRTEVGGWEMFTVVKE
jgi:hypothetical protein